MRKLSTWSGGFGEEFTEEQLLELKFGGFVSNPRQNSICKCTEVEGVQSILGTVHNPEADSQDLSRG